MVAAVKSHSETVVLPEDIVKGTKRARFLGLFDIGVILAVLLIFFLFLTVLMRVVFPQGARLTEFAAVERSAGPESTVRGVIDIAGSDVNTGIFDAYLADVRRDVKIRPADSVAWESANAGTEVRNRDAVQTFSKSRARVDFTTDNNLQIGQNSLIVFRSGAADPFLERREPAVVVMDGELSGQVNAEYGTFDIEFPAGLVELKADEQSKEAVNFRVGVNPDQSSTIVVYSGKADINVAGEHYKVGASEGITIDQNGRTSGVSNLPSVPAARQPAHNQVMPFLQIPPRVVFGWSSVVGAVKYRLEIATDNRFEDIVVDEKLTSQSFVHGNLMPGDYFWRVSALQGWVQGPATQTRRLRVVPDAMPPNLSLQPIERLTADTYLLRGSASRYARVYVLGSRVRTGPDGRFEFRFKPQPGTQTIVVEAVDGVGNTSYSSQLLHVPGNTGGSN